MLWALVPAVPYQLLMWSKSFIVTLNTLGLFFCVTALKGTLFERSHSGSAADVTHALHFRTHPCRLLPHLPSEEKKEEWFWRTLFDFYNKKSAPKYTVKMMFTTQRIQICCTLLYSTIRHNLFIDKIMILKSTIAHTHTHTHIFLMEGTFLKWWHHTSSENK